MDARYGGSLSKLARHRARPVEMAMFDQRTNRDTDQPLTLSTREEIVRRYWMNGDLTPLAVANRLAGQPVPRAA